MISLDMYKSTISSDGKSLGEIRKAQSNFLMNATFTGDIQYKRVRVLTRDGWNEYDAKYQFRQEVSNAKDMNDWYIQFRPGVHFPVGTYIIMQNEEDDGLQTFEDQLSFFDVQNIKNSSNRNKRTQLWMIENKDDADAFTRYNIVRCNWNFRWIYNGTIQNIIGYIKSANSYTSGIVRGDYDITLDNLGGALIPDTYYCYGNALSSLGLCDTRVLTHGVRMMITNNTLNPSVWTVSKIWDMNPMGIIKVFLKQGEYNVNTDNADLLICDYYTQTRNQIVEEPTHYEEDIEDNIIELTVNNNNELEEVGVVHDAKISIGIPSYFKAKNWNGEGELNWKITLDASASDGKHPNSYYENLLKIRDIDSFTISITAGKAKSLIGKSFVLCTYDSNGNEHSKITLEVI